MNGQSKETKALFIRNFIFGVEDSLVSTVGLLSGVAIADVPRATIFLTGMVLIVVEALSMGVGSLLSESSAQEFVKQRKTSKRTTTAALIMFVSYFASGFIPLAPYLLITDVERAFPLSIGASLIALFLLGYISAKWFKANVYRSAFRMFVLGGIAIAAGVAVGVWLR